MMKSYDGREIRRSWGIAAAGMMLVIVALLMFALSGCSNQTVRDLEGVPINDPDKVELIVNVDQFPNLTAMCVNGAGFATTTRDAAGAIMRVEEWDASNGGWCAG